MTRYIMIIDGSGTLAHRSGLRYAFENDLSRPMPHTVSVIIPCFNAARYLERTIASVQAQSFADWEILLADDASTDGTLELAHSLAKSDPRIRVLEAIENGGAARARNRAMQAASGRYLAFLDADDCWRPEKLEHQIAHMQATGAALSYTEFVRHFDDGGSRHVKLPETVNRNTLLRGNLIACSTAIYDREQLGLIEMPDVRMRQDFGLWLRILDQVPMAHGLCEPLTDYTVRTDSLSANKAKALGATWRLFHDVEGFGALKSTWLLAQVIAGRLKRG
ncbi:glycosyltransferase family 2 protein [Aliiroseovarius sp. KMU-50]|uniref:Glycosyltransferase family 2 protein n=1 Tax=Aliiroseovarius salicola TaxID=3009082 RepID=A0ABT4VX90_9RHOB|nr:glycosyltransferase family 2 protein [Aliiroseovarius sp. KMU-50]MDA5092865.1 glycosyltransferase family 2 protein [Aliiroseovarius sp. KMU-50]